MKDDFKNINMRVDDQDILIRMQPVLDHQNNWTGDVNLSVIDSKTNPLSDRDYTDIMFFARMCLVGIDLLRTDEDYSKKVYHIVQDELKEEAKPKISLSDKPIVPVTSRQGNVIRVDFNNIKRKLNGSE
tara:strand:+ start:477 stop:863 length:387 start_codon:yes stop_codon:yes gene_type:complete